MSAKPSRQGPGRSPGLTALKRTESSAEPVLSIGLREEIRAASGFDVSVEREWGTEESWNNNSHDLGPTDFRLERGGGCLLGSTKNDGESRTSLEAMETILNLKAGRYAIDGRAVTSPIRFEDCSVSEGRATSTNPKRRCGASG